jgi:hypothetical protein
MKYCSLILVIFCFNYCSMESKKIDGRNSNFDSSRASRLPGLEIINFDSFKISVNVDEISLDSVIISVDFTNGCTDTLKLLKRILPSDTLKEGIFNLFKADGNYFERIEPKPIVSKSKYAMGTQFIVPAVIPNFEIDSFEIFKPNDVKKYRVNLARIYDFKKIDEKELYMNCIIYFPLIKRDKHVTIVSPHDSSLMVPVYFRVGTLKDTEYNRKHNLLKINVPLGEGL